MKVALALFAVCAIAAACGKKLTYPVSTELNLAILQDNGGIFENTASERFVLREDGSVSTHARTSTAAIQHNFGIGLRESKHDGRLESEISLSVTEPGEPEQPIAILEFRLPAKELSAYSTVRENCYIEGTVGVPGTCRIRSIIISKDNVDRLGNKSRLFKHTSQNYRSAEGHGISYCELAFESARLEWQSGGYAGAARPAELDQGYKYSFLSSNDVGSRDRTYQLNVTCFKNMAKERGKTDFQSVFKGVFKQSQN
jgi:hypothetical protein